jgi:membrane protein YqaA with SNARE-associated domain
MKLPLGRYQAKFDEWSVRLGRSKRGVDLVMFSSSLWGVPPFLVVPYLAGVFKLSFERFLLLGMLGRLLRFSAVVSVPALVKALAR